MGCDCLKKKKTTEKKSLFCSIYTYTVTVHLEQMCCPPCCKVIYSTRCKIILVLLTVHSLMDRLRIKEKCKGEKHVKDRNISSFRHLSILAQMISPSLKHVLPPIIISTKHWIKLSITVLQFLFTIPCKSGSFVSHRQDSGRH